MWSEIRFSCELLANPCSILVVYLAVVYREIVGAGYSCEYWIRSTDPSRTIPECYLLFLVHLPLVGNQQERY